MNDLNKYFITGVTPHKNVFFHMSKASRRNIRKININQEKNIKTRKTKLKISERKRQGWTRKENPPESLQGGVLPPTESDIRLSTICYSWRDCIQGLNPKHRAGAMSWLLESRERSATPKQRLLRYVVPEVSKR